MKNSELKLFDKRTCQRNIRLGHLPPEEYQKFIKALPDDSQNYDVASFEEPDDDDLPLEEVPPSGSEGDPS